MIILGFVLIGSIVAVVALFFVARMTIRSIKQFKAGEGPAIESLAKTIDAVNRHREKND